MKRSTLLLLSLAWGALCGNMAVYGQSVLNQLKAGRVQTDSTGVTGFVCTAPDKVLVDKSFVLSFPDLNRDQLKHKKEQKKYPKFKAKKDHIEHFVLDQLPNGSYNLFVLNKIKQVCEMSEFSIVNTSSNMMINEANGFLQASIAGTPLDYIQHKIANTGELTFAYKKDQNIRQTVSYAIRLQDNIDWKEKDGVFVVERIEAFGSKYCHVSELTTGTTWYVRCPFVIDASGKDGKNGSRGSDGMHGLGQHTYTDREGKQRTAQGTCGTAGSNGGPGEDGGNGGHVVVYVANHLNKDQVKVNVSKGKGGRGGSGGIGGTHGYGSPCRGKAADGRPGRNGKDGKDGQSEIIRVIPKVVYDFHHQSEIRIERPAVKLPLSPLKAEKKAKKRK